MAKQKGNVYDVTVKDLFDNDREVLINYFGSIKVEQAEELEVEFSRFQSRRSDLVMKAQMEGYPIAVHIEFQSSNDKGMRYRMLRYAAEIYKQYKLPIYQMVMYLGQKEPDMADEIAYNFGTTNRLDYRYKIVDIGGIAYEELKASNNPLLYSLLPLTDRQRRKTEKVKFLERCVKDIADAPFKIEEKRETAARAEVFAGLVFSQDIIERTFEEVERMLNLEESAGYRRIFEKGKADIIIRLLQKKFKTVPENYIERIRRQNDEVLDAIADNIFNIQNIDELNDYLR